MKFVLPFSDETIAELAGKTVVVSENHRNEALFRPFLTVPVRGGGDTDNGYFDVQDGNLRFNDRQGLLCDFSGLEARNGSVFATGKMSREAQVHGFERITLHEQVLLPIDGFGICISSNVNYSGKTLPLLLDSIRKAKFDMSKVVAVVGGYKGEKTEEIEGAKVIYRESDGKGFGGLRDAVGGVQYNLLLHDTCEAERNFAELIGKIDIGLSPDVVRLRKENDEWMGLYSTDFISKILNDVLDSPNKAISIIKVMASVVTIVPGRSVETGKKDIYGTGNIRKVESISSVGIRKFKSTTKARNP